MAAPLLQVEGLTMRYETRQGWVKAVEGVSFILDRGEALGLVGESGSGKTSLANCLLRVLPDNAKIMAGRVLLDGTDLLQLSEEQMRRARGRRIAMVFQAAMSSLSPVHRVGDQIAEAMQVHQGGGHREHSARVAELFTSVGLEPELASRYPHELSGGMRQRAVIAMALSCRPDVVIADEPTTALDVIVQAKVLKELRAIQQGLRTAMIYISHDMAVIAEVTSRIAVMYAGQIVELAATDELLRRPAHPYSSALMAAFPPLRGPKRPLVPLPGDPPDLISPPSGCHFHPRCPVATPACQEQAPPLQQHAPGHLAACWHPLTGAGGHPEASSPLTEKGGG